MNTTDTREKVNPVFTTAKLTLYWLALTGNPDAEAYMEALHFDSAKVPQTVPQYEVMEKPNAVSIDHRHNAMNHFILESGYDNVLDLACGYTPRGLAMYRQNKRYVGGDLPAVTEEMELVAEEMSRRHNIKEGHMCYRAVDVTNFDSMKAAADLLDGALCIVTEGLLMYLGAYEQKAVCQNIRRILLEHGGCWITQDMEVGQHFVTIFRTLLGDKAMEALYTAKNLYNSKSDAEVETNLFDNSTEEAIAFFERMGLRVERFPFYADSLPLHSLDSLSPEKAAAMRKALSGCYIWRMTPVESAVAEENQPQTKAAHFALEAQSAKNELRFTVKGRLDTLSAPELLTTFKTHLGKDVFTDICIDMTNLAYLSSAGLRVLLIMKKAKPNGKLYLTGVNETVKEILETTGFADIATCV